MIKKLTDKDRKNIYKVIKYNCLHDIDKYKYFMQTCKMKPIKNSSFKKIEYISIVKGRIQGYFAYLLDLVNVKVTNIEIISFDETTVLVRDFLIFCDFLVKRYENLEISIIPDSPAYRIARRSFQKYGFKKIGTLEKSLKLKDKRYYDLELWQRRGLISGQ